MLLYESVKEGFMDCVLNDCIVDKIEKEYVPRFGKVNISEKRAWKNSMEYMFKVLTTEDIPGNTGIAIEFNVPYTSKRIDFILSGISIDKKETAIIIELKQWENIEKVTDKDGIVRTFVGGGNREVPHPSYQAWSYASVIEDFNELVQDDEISLYPCAYLHNYQKNDNDPLTDKIYIEYLEKAPVFLEGDVIKLREFISNYIKYGDNKSILYKIENGKLRPSKSLQDCLLSMIKGNSEFIMIDEQKTVYEQALKMAKASKKDNLKRVLIIEGGPGTGKSVLAINLLVELTRLGLLSQYVSKNAAPRNVYFKKLRGKIKNISVKNLFKGSGSYTDTLNNEFDTLIVDEAHRLNAKSGMFQNYGVNQIKEIIHASKFSVFFIDEDQRIHIKDIGEISTIKKYAQKANAILVKMELESQFRCNGSDGYLAWVDNVLDIRKTANFNGFDGEYDFRVFDNPNDMRTAIFEKNRINNKARLVAGYCWDWPKNERNNPNYYDIQIPAFDFKIGWNFARTDSWAIDPNSVNEAGCIHTCQGLEFDYVGVIIGDDMRYEDGKIITDFRKRAKTDQSMKGIKKWYCENSEEALKTADMIIKNTYRTLMTRGMKGCYVYCVDDELRNIFIELLSGVEG